MNEIRFRNFYANFVIVSILVLVFAVSFVVTYPQNVQAEQVNNAIYNGNQNGQCVAVTINVYERTDNVQKIAEIFDEYGFKATFFVGGLWASKNGDTLLKLAINGFEIGNHGYSHRDHAQLNVEQNKKEISITQKVIDEYLCQIVDYRNSKLFAPPSGSMGNDMFEACQDLGYKVIMWSKDTIDWRDQDVNLIFSRATKNLKAGDIILMHPTEATIIALPQILDYIKSQNLSAVTVSNLLSC